MQRKRYSQKAGRVVRKTMADGTIREYRYGAWAAERAQRHAADTIGALSVEWRLSPEWAAFSESTREHYTIYLRELEALAALPVGDIKRRDILSIRDAIATTRGNGAATGFMRAASAAFAWALGRGWIEHTPCHRIKPLPQGSLPAWTEEQAAIALAGLAEPFRRAVLLALHTGQRRGDLVAMGWNAYDGVALRFTQKKTNKKMEVPVHPYLQAELTEWRQSATSTLILTTAQGLPWEPAHLSHMLPKHLAKIGLPAGLNIHGLRKLAATRLAMAGCSAHEIAAITGHRTLAMVAHYTASADQGRLAQAAIVRLRAKETRR